MKRLVFIFILLILFSYGSPRAVVTKTVCASGCDYNLSQVQTAINAISCGDTITIADAAEFGNNYTLPVLGSVGSCTTPTKIRRAGQMPDIIDMIPCGYQLGPTQVAEIAKMDACKASVKASIETNAPKCTLVRADIIAGNTCFILDWNADYWELDGLELRNTQTTTDAPYNYGLIQIGLHNGANYSDVTKAPNHFVMDRMSIHGNPLADSIRGIYGNGKNITLENSIVYEFHTRSSGADGQCFYANTAPGGILIQNNILDSCGGEGVLFGAAANVTGLVQGYDGGIVQTRNIFTRNWTHWPHADRLGYTYDGQSWVWKNLTECKSCMNNSVFGNLFENAFEGSDAQRDAFIFQSVPDQPCAWCTVRNIHAYNNIVRHSNSFTGAAGRGGQFGGGTMGGQIYITNNLAFDIALLYSDSGTNWAECFHTASGSNGNTYSPFDTVVYDHNTCDHEGDFMTFVNPGDVYTNLTITNSLFRGRYNYTNLKGSPTNGGTDALDYWAPSSYTVGHLAFASYGIELTWPANVDKLRVPGDDAATLAAFSAIFVNRTIYNYTVANGSDYKAGGSKQASDGKDLGVDMSLLPQSVSNIIARPRIVCNTTPPINSVVMEGNVAISLCHDGKGVTGWAALLNNVRQSITLTTNAIADDVTGLMEYIGTLVMIPGIYITQFLAIYGSNGDSPVSDPVTVTVTPKPPVKNKPVKVKVG